MNLKNVVVHFRLSPVLLLASALVLGDEHQPTDRLGVYTWSSRTFLLLEHSESYRSAGFRGWITHRHLVVGLLFFNLYSVRC